MTFSLPPDPYKILGVSKDAQIPDIRSAYRKLVLKCHPDKVQDPALKAQKQEEFQKVQQAYELLSDDVERQKYDDQVKLADLRKQFQNKANISTPRSPTKYTEYEIRTAEPRASSYKPTSNHVHSAMPKPYTYSRSWEEDMSHGTRIFEPASRSSRREPTYAAKRESERERERDRDREKERERERERRKKSEKEEAARRAEKDAKEARRAEKKQRDKQRDKDMKRESEEKKKHAKPYIEDFSDDLPTPKSEKKKSSSKKYEEKRDRSSHREETPVMPPPPARSFPEYATTYTEPPETAWATDMKHNFAATYIEMSRAKDSGLKRSTTYHARTTQPPAAPTPPPAPSQSSPFPVPVPAQEEDDVRRSSARSRRGSTESTRMQRDKTYRRSSREQMEEPIMLSASPPSRAPFQRASTTTPIMSTSPPHLSRTGTMPSDSGYSRSMPTMARAQTFNSYGEASDPRGRNRSRMQPQIDEEPDSDDNVYESRTRDRKHRGSKGNRSPEPAYAEGTARHPYDARQATYSRRIDPEADRYSYYPSSGHATDSRPSMPARESSYSTSAGSAQFGKVKTSKAYSHEDVQYSHYHPHAREEYSTTYA